jgi:predicted HAD superfamily Cof-like phosphohydrolase
MIKITAKQHKALQFYKDISNTTRSSTRSSTRMLTSFQLAMESDIGEPVTEELLTFRNFLLNEELDELAEASQDLINSGFTKETKAAYLKELCDVCYVMVGTAVSFGWDFDEAFRRVHDSNMSKLVDGRPYKDTDGKVMKGPNYKPCDLGDLV